MTPLPMKATGCALASARAVPAHHHQPAVVRGALADAEQRAHAELHHRLVVEDLDLDAELGSAFARGGEFGRKEHVRRLVDEVAREKHALGDAVASLHAPFAPQHRRRTAIVDGDRTWPRPRPPCGASCSDRRHRRAAAAPRREVGGGARLAPPRGGSSRTVTSVAPGRQAPHDDAAEPRPVGLPGLLARAEADDDQPRHRQPGGRDDIEAGIGLAAEAVALGGALQEVAGGRQEGGRLACPSARSVSARITAMPRRGAAELAIVRGQSAAIKGSSRGMDEALERVNRAFRRRLRLL